MLCSPSFINFPILRTCKRFPWITALYVLKKAQAALKEDNSIKCTGCRYCTPGCPMQIALPEIFASMNEYLRYRDRLKFQRNYGIAIRNGNDASACIQCGQCEQACPQHLSIIQYLQDTRAKLNDLFPDGQA